MSDDKHLASIKLIGMEGLVAAFKALPHDVASRARKRGVNRAAARFRTKLRRDAPKAEKPKHKWRLKSSINAKQGKVRVWVGLTIYQFYKTLDFESARGAPLHPWFEASVEEHQPLAAQLMIDETKKALGYEAGKYYAKSKIKRT